MKREQILIGTCSWNYDSWVGLVYSRTRPRSCQYLPEYSKKYTTVEIDSWFYQIPSVEDVEEYRRSVEKDFRFTCKVPRMITLTHGRKKERAGGLVPNKDFLSPDLFNAFISRIEPLLPRIDAIMFEFEYLNRMKMASLSVFLQEFSAFLPKLPAGLPYALEIRNSNYLKQEYFSFINSNNLIHVFSEKQYMPEAYKVYDAFGGNIKGDSVIRLLGGDRKAIEAKTGGYWREIVEQKNDLPDIVDLIDKLSEKGIVTVNVNNHYEGSAPKTIQRIEELLDKFSTGK